MRASQKPDTAAQKALSSDGEDVTWARARRPEQKKIRRDAILAAAVTLLDQDGLEATTLSAIARESGMTKANVYRYFESREAILLAVTLVECDAWLNELSTRLASLAGSGDIDAVARTFAACITERPRVCALVSSLSSVLERNVGVEVIADFKRSFISIPHQPFNAIHEALPALSVEGAQSFIMFSYVFIAGAWPMANPPAAVAEVLTRPEFSEMCIDFEVAVRDHAITVLQGLCAPGS